MTNQDAHAASNAAIAASGLGKVKPEDVERMKAKADRIRERAEEGEGEDTPMSVLWPDSQLRYRLLGEAGCQLDEAGAPYEVRELRIHNGKVKMTLAVEAALPSTDEGANLPLWDTTYQTEAGIADAYEKEVVDALPMIEGDNYSPSEARAFYAGRDARRAGLSIDEPCPDKDVALLTTALQAAYHNGWNAEHYTILAMYAEFDGRVE